MEKINEHSHKNIGVIVPSLENAQLPFEVISAINTEIANGSQWDYRIFFENFGPHIVNPMCAVMNVGELHYYSGLLVSTTIDNTRLSLKVPGKLRRIFLIWDLEWLRSKGDFFDNMQVYRDPRLILVARSKDMANAITNYTNRRPHIIIEHLQFSELAKVI